MNWPITRIGAVPETRTCQTTYSSESKVVALATRRGSGAKRLLRTSHALSRIAPMANTHNPGDCAASAKPVMPMISSVYSAGLNWRMSYIWGPALGVARVLMRNSTSHLSRLFLLRLLIGRHAVREIDGLRELEPALELPAGR